MTALAKGTLPDPVSEQLIQKPLPGAGAAQTVQGLALVTFRQGDHSFTDDPLLVGCELLEIVQQLVGDSGHQEKLHCAGRRIKRLCTPQVLAQGGAKHSGEHTRPRVLWLAPSPATSLNLLHFL